MEDSGSSLLATYERRREALLAQIEAVLQVDPRFVAAWLGGSLGRGDGDALSDLDLTLVVAGERAAEICARRQAVSIRPSGARLSFFEQFGEIAFVYENNHNAPPGGTSTTVLYSAHGVIVDWMLVPRVIARRPGNTRLLFAKVEIPMAGDADAGATGERLDAASELIGFFWMMAAVVVKYLLRGDGVFVVRRLEELAEIAAEVERQLAGHPWQYRRGSRTELIADEAGQLKLLRSMCEQVGGFSEHLAVLGGDVWPSAGDAVERLLVMAEQVIKGRQGS